MKKTFWLLSVLFLCGGVHSQVLKRLGERAKNKMEQKAGDKIDKGIDDATDGKKPEKKKSDGSTSSKEVEDQNENEDVKGKKSDPASLKSYSKYDFVPGEKVITYEDFSKPEIGDFPATWNTNSSGEVVIIDGQEGHWLMISKKGRFIPENIKSLPDNFTFQFDLICNEKF